MALGNGGKATLESDFGWGGENLNAIGSSLHRLRNVSRPVTGSNTTLR